MITIDNLDYNKEFVKNYLKTKEGQWDTEDIQNHIISNLPILDKSLRMVNMDGYLYGDSVIYSFTFHVPLFTYPNKKQLEKFLMSLYDEDIMRATITEISPNLIQATLVITL